MDARAFTSGTHIVFAHGVYDPASDDGTRLLAHELAHVAQQRAPGVVYRTNGGGASQTTLSAAKNPEFPAAAVPPEGADVFELGPFKLTADEGHLRALLLNLIAKEGSSAALELVSHVRGFMLIHGAFGSMSQEELKELSEKPTIAKDIAQWRLGRTLLPKLERVHTTLDQEKTTYVTGFEDDARKLACELLKQSEDRVKAEAIKYGLTEEQIRKTETGCYETACWETETKETVYHIADNSPSKAGLAAAATVLVSHRNTVEGKRRELLSHQWVESSSVSSEGVTHYRDDQYDVVAAEMEQEIKKYHDLHNHFQSRYPILGDIGALERSPDRLAQLASDNANNMAAVIGPETADRRKKINDTRAGLQPGGEGNVWGLDRIVSMLKAVRGLGEGTWELRVVNEKQAAETWDKTWKELALGVLSLAFSLLAPVTGGLSLIAAAGISGYLAYEHLKEYEFQRAASGSDFSRARTVSAEEPTLLWLALDILGAMLDVGAVVSATARAAATIGKASRILKAVAPEVKAAQAAGQAIDPDALGAAARAAGADEQVVKAIVRSVEQHVHDARAVERAAGATPKDIDLLAEAAKRGEQIIESEGALVLYRERHHHEERSALHLSLAVHAAFRRIRRSVCEGGEVCRRAQRLAEAREGPRGDKGLGKGPV